MPVTFPSHAAAVLPLKLWRPRWFDGVALAVGSAAPDLAYALDGTRLERPASDWPATYQIAHSWAGIVLWSLPVTLLCAWLIRLAAPVVARHLPAGLRLGEYAVLGQSRPRAAITVLSALVGAASHVVWDRIADHGLADVASSVAGAAVTTVLIGYVGRTGRLRAWHGAAPVRATSPHRFWWPALATALLGAALLPALPGAELPHTTGVRILCLIMLSLLVGAASTGQARRPLAVRAQP